MSIKYNFVLAQGETLSLTFNIKDKNGNLIDLTNYSFVGKIKEKYDSTIVGNLVFTIPDQRANKGVLQISMPAAATKLIPVDVGTLANKRPIKEYIYDIFQTDPAAVVTRIVEGTIAVSASVTP